jgi:hypothetical protein
MNLINYVLSCSVVGDKQNAPTGAAKNQRTKTLSRVLLGLLERCVSACAGGFCKLCPFDAHLKLDPPHETSVKGPT